MLVGDILVRMAADMAELRSGFDQAKGTVQKFRDDTQVYIDDFVSKVQGLVTIAAFSALAKQVIDYGTELKKLQDITGLTAGEVQHLSAVAQLNDTDTQALVRSWGKLVTQLVDVGTEGDKTRAIMKALGVDAFDPLTGKVRPAGELMGLLAAQFNAIEDPATRAKVASEFFSKSYADMLVIFKNWNDDSAKVAELLGKIGYASDDATTKADALGDSFDLMTIALKASLLDGLTQFADLIEKVRQLTVPAKDETSLFSNAMAALALVLGAVVDAVYAFFSALQVLAAPLVAVVGTIIAGTKALMGGEGFVAAGEAMAQAFRDSKSMVDVFNTAAEKMNGTVRDGTMATHDQVHAMLDANEKLTDNGNAALAAAKAQKEFEDRQKAAAAEAKKQAAELENLRAKYELLKTADDLGIATNTLTQLRELQRLMDAGKISWDDYIAVQLLILDKDPLLAAAQRDVNKAFEDTEKIVRKVIDAWGDELDALDDQIQKQRDANAAFGLGKAALVDLAIAQLDVKIATERAGDAYSPYADHLVDVRNKMLALRDALAVGDALEKQKTDLENSKKAWASTFDSINESAREVFMGLWDDTASAWENMWASMKKAALAALYEIAAKPIVVQIVAAVAGAGGLPGLANAATGSVGAGGDLFGSLAKAIPGLATGIGDLAFAAADFAQLLGQGVGIVDAFGMAASSAGLTLGSLVPVVGAVVAAGTLLYQWVKSKEGGPKEGGFATTGAVPGIGGVDSTGRWMTPSGADSDILGSLNQLNAQFEAVATALGGVGAAVFALGYDTDPKGTAPSNVHSGVWVNGTQIYNSENPNVGRSPEELQAQLELESKRMLLAALQSTELPAAVHAALMAVDVTTASIAEINAALEQAAAKKAMIDELTSTLAGMPESLANALVEAVGVSPEIDADIAEFMDSVQKFQAAQAKFKEAADAFWSASGKVQEALDRDPKAEALNAYAEGHRSVFEKVQVAKDALLAQVAAYDGSTTATNDLAAATNAYRDAQVAAIVQVYALRDALLGPEGLFAQTQHTLDWALMSKTEQTNWLINEAKATVDLLKTTTDPAQIEKFSQLINQDLTQAFSMMSPEEQAAQHAVIKGILENAKNVVAAQLDIAEQTINDSTIAAGTTLGSVQVVLDDAGQKWNDAAQKMNDTADKLLDAAQAIVDAATDAKNAAANNVAASNTMAAAATTMETAANTPVPVEVTVNLETVSGP